MKCISIFKKLFLCVLRIQSFFKIVLRVWVLSRYRHLKKCFQDFDKNLGVYFLNCFSASIQWFWAPSATHLKNPRFVDILVAFVSLACCVVCRKSSKLSFETCVWLSPRADFLYESKCWIVVVTLIFNQIRTDCAHRTAHTCSTMHKNRPRIISF